MIARTKYLGKDRSEIHFAVKDLGKEMSNPNPRSWLKLKMLLTYLKSNPRYRWLFGHQGQERNVVAWSDSDFAGCTKYRSRPQLV